VHANNHLGSLGENIVSLLLQRKLNGCYRFSVRFLGAKAELLDFLVELLDDDGKAYGPHFYLQVKTTASASTARETRMQLYKEVDAYFNSLPLSFKSALT
jgi:hypothetical protein